MRTRIRTNRHSKGNLVLSEALYAIEGEHPLLAEAVATRSRIVTISAKVGMPSLFKDVIDVVCAWDWFGALNSRPDISAEVVVPHAWHSTNPDLCSLGRPASEGQTDDDRQWDDNDRSGRH